MARIKQQATKHVASLGENFIRLRSIRARSRQCLRSAGCEPAGFGSLPTPRNSVPFKIACPGDVVGRLPTTTGWQPVLPRYSRPARYQNTASYGTIKILSVHLFLVRHGAPERNAPVR